MNLEFIYFGESDDDDGDNFSDSDYDDYIEHNFISSLYFLLIS